MALQIVRNQSAQSDQTRWTSRNSVHFSPSLKNAHNKEEFVLFVMFPGLWFTMFDIISVVIRVVVAIASIRSVGVLVIVLVSLH